MSKIKSFFADVKEHWNTPDASKNHYVSYKEYGTIFLGVAMNYGVQAPLKYIGFGASCYLIMYHYNLPYLAFSIIGLIGLPLSYLWSILGWVIVDNLGMLEKKVERKYVSFYGFVTILGLLMMIFDTSQIMPEALVTKLNGLPGVNAMSFFKIFGVQLFCSAYSGLRSLFFRKKLIPKYGRYKYTLFANYIQKCVMIILIGWLPIYNIKDVNTRLWLAYLLFNLFGMFDFSNVIESCTQTISPNPQERLWVRTWPVKISHLLENVFEVAIPLFGIAFSDIRLYKYVLPGLFIPLGAITLLCTRGITERIPQPPLEKKQKVSFWYGVSQVLKNKYRWLNMISSMIDSLGNGAIHMATIMYFFSMRLYTQSVVYAVISVVYMFRTTPTSFLAPYFINRFSFRTLILFRQCCEIIRCVSTICAVLFFRDRQELCGAIILVVEFVTKALSQVCSIAGGDMDIRLSDYQMYLSGERLEASRGVFSWIMNPVTTIVGLIIPIIVLRNGFNSNWDVLYIDSSRFGIIAVPIIFDLVGHILMIIPYLFWDYNHPQHEYVIEVLKQREMLANEEYYPAEYEGGLNFANAESVKNGIPANSAEILARIKNAEAEAESPQTAEV